MFSPIYKISVLLYLLFNMKYVLLKEIHFHGQFPPVFTPMDKMGAVNVSAIPEYAKCLSLSSCVNGVVGLPLCNNKNGEIFCDAVADIAGEGTNLSVDEKKEILTVWVSVAKKYNLKVIMQIGGVPGPDIFELESARYATAVGVDAVLALPPMSYHAPSISPEELTLHIELLSQITESIPIFYYHYPEATGLQVDFPAFFAIASYKVPQFKGIKADLRAAMAVNAVNKLRPDQTILIFDHMSIPGAALMGFDSYSLTVMNIFPVITNDIINYTRDGDVEKARKSQEKLNKLAAIIMARGDYVTAFKTTMEIVTKLSVGNTRIPLHPLSESGIKNIVDVLKDKDISIAV